MGAIRMLRHVCGEGSARRQFPARTLDAIQHAVADGEKRHSGQVMFAVEGALPLHDLVRGRSARARAREVFAHLRVWDTKHDCGVLIYVLLADHAIEILADRGIAAKVAETEWQSIAARMQARFAAGEFERGAIDGVNAVGELLAKHFSADGTPRDNELPDRPVLL